MTLAGIANLAAARLGATGADSPFPYVPEGFHHNMPFALLRKLGGHETRIRAGYDYFGTGAPEWSVEVNTWKGRGAVAADGTITWAEPGYKPEKTKAHYFRNFDVAVRVAQAV